MVVEAFSTPGVVIKPLGPVCSPLATAYMLGCHKNPARVDVGSSAVDLCRTVHAEDLVKLQWHHVFSL